MIHFERTKDWEAVRGILGHPAVFPHITDDFSEPIEKWSFERREDAWFVLAKDDEETLGLWVFVPKNAICWEAHTCLLPNARGPRGAEAAKSVLAWIWENTPCLRVVGEIPIYNHMSAKFAVRAGMYKFGINSRSCIKNGRLYDQVLVGISKPGVN